MSHSLGEIDNLARKAARGAGMSWGLAEEAGPATRWLCAHALPGAEYLAALLEKHRTRDHQEALPVPDSEVWSARSGALCPIATGAALSDRADAIAETQTLRLLVCDAPFLLLPFLASIAKRTGTAIGLRVEETSAVCSPKALYLGDGAPDVSTPPLDVTLTPKAPLKGMHVPAARRAHPTVAALNTLSLFAERLYAPETEARRQSGAGEGS